MPKKQLKELTPEEKFADEFISNNNITTKDAMYEGLRNLFGPVFQRLLEAEMSAKIGYNRNERNDEVDNYRNGYYPDRTVITEYGEIPIRVPRDRNGEIESDLVPKYSRTVDGFDQKIIGLYAIGMSDTDISEQIDQLFGCKLTPDMISNITDKIIPDMQDWQKRKLDNMYPVVFIDAMHHHVRDNNQVVKKASYVALGINQDGKKEVLSIQIGESESAKFWMGVLTDLKNRGVGDILILCADGLTGLKEAIPAVYPNTEFQRCIVHQIRNSMKFVPHKDKKELANDLRTVYTAPTEELGYTNLLEINDKWKNKYPSAVNSWVDNWDVLSTFFKFSPEVRKIMYTTNAIESLNSMYRRVNKARPVFTNSQALLKTLYLATGNIQKKWTGRIDNWDLIISQLRVFYPGRI